MANDQPNQENAPGLADSDAPMPSAANGPSSPQRTGQRKPQDEAQGEPPAAKTGGASTGGFDTMLGQLVVQQGLVTADEVQQCRSHLKSKGQDQTGTLGDLLLAHEFITRRQMARLRRDFEARKSTQRIPGYRIKRKLGAGAMATVFLAEQISLDRLVAIKVLPRKFSEDRDFIARFYKEGRAAASLNHPNIVQAIDVGHAQDHHYFVMEFVEGETVYEKISRDKRIKETEAIDILRQSARALLHAHDKGFIHRDIKPKNLMLTKGGQVKLADLGLARSVDDHETAKAEAGRAYGTPYYISPEQIRGSMDIGPQADIYGLGATAYHMVTGQVPFNGKNPSEVMHRHLKAPLEPPDHLNPTLSAEFSQVLEMMLAKDCNHRYRTAADLLEDLELLRRGEAPHFARPKLNLQDMAVSVGGDDAANVPAAPKRAKRGIDPALAWGSIVLNCILLIVIVLMALR
ncbi:MAG: serine/threonine protein kinase [Phycisphaerales bacterium]|nr:serine/threonine protein kinase [Phycisphaerales bacterium]